MKDPKSLRILKIVKLITSAKSLVLCKVSHSQVLGIRTWISLGGVFILLALDEVVREGFLEEVTLELRPE